MSVFEEMGKPEYPEKNLWEQGKEPTTNFNEIAHCANGSLIKILFSRVLYL